jgi:hypothetical protein
VIGIDPSTSPPALLVRCADGLWWPIGEKNACAADDDLIHAAPAVVVADEAVTTACGASGCVPFAHERQNPAGETAVVVATWPPYKSGAAGRGRCSDCWEMTGHRRPSHSFKKVPA